MRLNICKTVLSGFILTILGTVQAADLLYSPKPVALTYNDAQLSRKTVTVTLSGSTREPEIYPETSGTVNTCTIESVNRNMNSVEVTVKALAATSTTNTCRIIVTQAGDGVKPDASVSIPVTIAKGTQFISYELASNLVAGGPESKLYLFDYGSSNPVQLTTPHSSACPVNTSTSPWTIKAAVNFSGRCYVYVKKLGDANFNDKSEIFPIDVGKGNTVITFTNPPNPLVLPYGQTFALNVSKTGSTSALTGGTSTGSVCTVAVPLNATYNSNSGNTNFSVKGNALGTCTVRAEAIASTAYDKGSNSLDIQIVKANQSMSLSGPSSMIVNNPVDLTITPGITGNMPVLTVQDETMCKVTVHSRTAARVEPYRSGVCVINGEQRGDHVYNDFPRTPLLSILVNRDKSPISFNYQPQLKVGGSDFPSVDRPNEVVYTSETPATCSVSLDAASGKQMVTGLHIGECKLSAFRAENDYYLADKAEQTFTVGQGTQTLSHNIPTSVQIGTPVAVSANSVSGSGQQLSITASPATVCSFSPGSPANSNNAGGILRGVAAGECRITLSQAGTADYAAASLTVTTRVIGTQSINFPALAPVAIDDGPLTLQASASSGLPVSFAISTPTYCALTGNTLSLLKTGTCSITATQSGNTDYMASEPVTQDLMILPPATSTSLSSSANPVLNKRSLSFTASVQGNAPGGNVAFLRNGQAIAGCELVPVQNGSATCNTSFPSIGVWSIVASYSGDANNQSSQSPALEQKVINLDWLPSLMHLLLN